MSIELTDDEVKSARNFIESFTEKTCDVVLTEVHELPIKPASFHCTRDEVKGECLHVAFRYLCNSGAPSVVSTSIARLAADKASGLDLSSFEVDVKNKKRYYDDEEEDEDDNVSSTAYDCGRLAVEAINAVHCVCKEWNSNMPALTKSRYSYKVYEHSEQNTRRKMEDKHIVVTELNNLLGLDKSFPSQAYFGVFDGHGGVDAAAYTVAHYHNNVFKQQTFDSDLDDALCRGFLETDKAFLEKAKNEGLRSGTTGVVVFLRDNTLHIGWLGDSQVTLCKRGMAVQLMEPHKPNRKDERKRIEDLGGCVVWFGDWRVNGNIAVSRSLGDRDHKPFVSADADSAEFDLEGDEDYLILGCDGLWDTIAPQDVVAIVQEHLAKDGARCEVAKLLVQSAIEHGSSDNITVVVVFLDCHRTDGNELGENETEEVASPATEEAEIENGDATESTFTAQEVDYLGHRILSNNVTSATY